MYRKDYFFTNYLESALECVIVYQLLKICEENVVGIFDELINNL